MKTKLISDLYIDENQIINFSSISKLEEYDLALNVGDTVKNYIEESTFLDNSVTTSIILNACGNYLEILEI